MKSWRMLKIAKIFVLVVIAAVAFGFFVMLLWNALIPQIFNGPTLSFWQAVGLLVLSHILLRGSGGWRHSGGWKHDRWKKKFEEKIAAMTPEERETFKEEWRRRCGYYPGEFDKKEESKQ